MLTWDISERMLMWETQVSECWGEVAGVLGGDFLRRERGGHGVPGRGVKKWN